MKKLFFIISLVLVGMSMSAQSVDDVTLVVSGDGTTKEEATHAALRSAVEQAYGVFVSANTEIFNDELVKDEIATVTSGNIKSFNELNTTILPNGNHMVTLQAVVSTKKLAAYAQSKGASCEFAGATFKANLKLLELNQQNTKKAFENMVLQLKSLAPYIYEKVLTVGNPDIYGNIDFYVDYYLNDAVWACRDIIMSTCSALNITSTEVQNLREMNADIYEYSISCSELYMFLGLWMNSEPKIHSYYFYSSFPEKEIDNTFKSDARQYIADNLNDNHSVIPLSNNKVKFAGYGSLEYRVPFNKIPLNSFQDVMDEDEFARKYYDKWRDEYYEKMEIKHVAFEKSKDTCFACDMFTYIIPPKKNKKGVVPSLPTCMMRYSSKISVQIDPERLGRISNFELKTIPEKYETLTEMMLDEDFVKLKRPEYIGKYVDILQTNVEKPIILIQEAYLFDNLVYLYELIWKYQEYFHFVGTYDSEVCDLAWNQQYVKDYDVWELERSPAILLIKDDKIIDYLWLKGEYRASQDDIDANKISLNEFIQKLLP